MCTAEGSDGEHPATATQLHVFSVISVASKPSNSTFTTLETACIRWFLHHVRDSQYGLPPLHLARPRTVGVDPLGARVYQLAVDARSQAVSSAVMVASTCLPCSPYRAPEFQPKETIFHYLGECYRHLSDAISRSSMLEALYTSEILVKYVIWNLEGESIISLSPHIFGYCRAVNSVGITSSFPFREYQRKLDSLLISFDRLFGLLVRHFRILTCAEKATMISSSLDCMDEIQDTFLTRQLPESIAAMDFDYLAIISRIVDYELYLRFSGIGGSSDCHSASLQRRNRFQDWLSKLTLMNSNLHADLLALLEALSFEESSNTRLSHVSCYRLPCNFRAVLIYVMLFAEPPEGCYGGARTAAKALLIILQPQNSHLWRWIRPLDSLLATVFLACSSEVLGGIAHPNWNADQNRCRDV